MGIDNRATAFISGDISDFEGPMVDSDRTVRGFAGTRVRGVQKGTAIIHIEDDDGGIHRVRLKDSYYVPGTKDRLFSPQHFAQQVNRQGKGPASETTDAERCVLVWGKYKRTIPLDPVTNVATIRTAPSYTKFLAYCAEAGLMGEEESTNPVAFDAALVSDDEDEDDDNWGLNSGINFERSGPSARGGERDEEWIDSHLPHTVLPDNDPAVVLNDEEDVQGRNESAELLDYHLRFGHASFTKLQIMAMLGLIPSRLKRCRIPVCAACMYGKATKRPWRTKLPKNKDEAYQAKVPGEVVAVDQLNSPTPGFIAQLTGMLTTKRYRYATVFVDAFSSRGYVYLQKTQSADETMEAKKAFERECSKDGVRVQHYHADNGIFRSKAWTDDCQVKGQSYSFAGVDAHHQNGRAEARIRRLQELTRAMLSHAKRKWPQEITANLWPYALRMANASINATPSLKDPEGRSPDQLFSKSEVTTNPKHWIHFGSPVYVLEASLRGSSRIHHKWKDRSKVGIYLGRSPQHGRSVALVLNPETGLVSPQFHVKHDGAFDTVKQLYGDSKHESKWQMKAGLMQIKDRQPRGADSKASSDTSNSQRASSENPDAVGRHARSRNGPAHEESQQSTSAPSQDANQDQGREQSEPEPTRAEGGNGQSQAQVQDSSSLREHQRASSRTRRPVQRLIEAMQAEIAHNTEDPSNEIFSYSALFPRDDEHEVDLIEAMKATADPDTLYLHEARRQPDWDNFAEAMQHEIEQQVSTGL